MVTVGSTPEATTYGSATQLADGDGKAAAQLMSGGELWVAVANGGLVSGSGTDLEVDNPAPTITTISPVSALAGTASAVVTVTGTGFVPSTVIDVNGSIRATTYINSTRV